MRSLPSVRPHIAASLSVRLARRLVGVVAALALTAGLFVALPPAASAADSTTDLGVNWSDRPGDLAVGHGKVFVANGDRIVVADTDGELVDAITGLSGAYGLAMAPDGAHLYAALIDSSEVIEIDTATLAINRRIDLAAYSCPTNLALFGDWLWVGHGCLNAYDGGVIGLDLSMPAPTPIGVASGLSGAPAVAAGGNTLAVGETGQSPSDIFVYDVSASPTLRGEIDGHTYGTSSPAELFVSPDGSNMLSASPTPYSFERWDTSSLTKVRSYGEEPTFAGFPIAVELSPDGTRVVGGRTYGTDITVYDATTGTKIHEVENNIGDVVARSVAFSGTDVFAVLRSTYDDRLHLWRLKDAALPASTLTLTPPSDPLVQRPLTLTGRLELADGTMPGAQQLSVARQLPDETSQTLDPVTTAADGTFTVTDIPPVSGKLTYAVHWDGGGSFRWSMTSATVAVKHPVSLTLTGPASASTGTRLTFNGMVKSDGLNYSRIPLQVERTVTNGSGSVTTKLPWVVPRVDGSYSFTDRPVEAGDYSYTVEWVGNDTNMPAKASHNVRVQG